MSDFIAPIPVEEESPVVRDLQDRIEFAELLFSDDPRGKRIITRMKARLAAALGCGRAADAAAAPQDENARLNAEYAKRLGKPISV